MENVLQVLKLIQNRVNNGENWSISKLVNSIKIVGLL